MKINFKKSIAVIIGESTGLLCLKKLIIARNNFFSKKKFLKEEKKIIKINKKCNFLISIYSSLLLSKNFLKSFNYQCYNFHPGILPFYPGKNCVSGAIYNSEKEIGVTIHKMEKKNSLRKNTDDKKN